MMTSKRWALSTEFVLFNSDGTGFVRVDKESTLERCTVCCVSYVS